MTTWPLIFLLAASLPSCAHKNKGAADTTGSKPDPTTLAKSSPPKSETTCTITKMDSCKAELEAVANCFFDAVTQTQKEPDDKPLAQFLGEITSGDAHAACAPLGLSQSCDRMTLSSGGEVVYEKSAGSHDLFEGGQEIVHIAYTFSAKTCPEQATSEIQLHIGRAAE